MKAAIVLLVAALAVLVAGQVPPGPNRFQLRLSPGTESYTTILTFLIEDSWANGTSPTNNPPLVRLRVPGPTNTSVGTNVTIAPYNATRYSAGWIYRAKFENLTEVEQKYGYQVVTNTATTPGNSAENTFHPLIPDPIRVSLIFIGSIDTGSTFQIYVPVIISIFGNVYGPGISPGSVAGSPTDASYNQLGKAIEPFAAAFPLLVGPGPADFDSTGSSFNYDTRFTMPTEPNVTMYYSTDFSNTHMISMSTFTNYTRGSAQYQWLEADLKAANMNRAKFPWIVVSGYSSMYSGIGSDYLLMEELEPLFTRYGVDLCIWNGHYFMQSKPMSGRYIADRYIGNGNATSPYFNAAPIHLLVGTGGLNLAQDCTGLSPAWSNAALCTYGVTNVTIMPNGDLFGVFQQLPFLHNFRVQKNLTIGRCAFDCRGNGVCDPYSMKCVCNESWYGADCGIYMKTQYIIPRKSEWEYTSGGENSTWEVDVTPFYSTGISQPFAQSYQFTAQNQIPATVGIFRRNFDLPAHPGEKWNLTLTVKCTRVPTSVSINGIPWAVKSGDESLTYYYGGVIVVRNDDIINSTFFNLNASNVIVVTYPTPVPYFESTMDLDLACNEGWTGPQCNIVLNASMDNAFPETVQTAEEIVSSPAGSNVPAIVTGVIGGVLFLGIVALIVFLVLRMKLRNPEPPMNAIGTSNYSTIDGGLAKESDWEVKYDEIEILRKIGEGAFGVVYQAKWRNAACVVKQMKMDVNDERAIRDFMREANNMKKLRPHPNVTDLLGICTAPGRPICILTEFLSEGSLSEMIERGKINIDAQLAISIARDVASGMSHLAEEKILHCDLAARNLLVALKGKDQYVVKVADFGLSHVSAESENYNINAETKFPVRWSAPEVMTRHQVSQKSDVWSYGVAIWEIIEQRKPYHNMMSNQEVMEQVCKGAILPRPTRIDIPDAFWELLKTCWAYEPRDRPLFQDLCRKLTELTERPVMQDAKSISMEEYSKTPANSEYKVTPADDGSNYRSSGPMDSGTMGSGSQSHYQAMGASDADRPNEYKQTPYAPIGATANVDLHQSNVDEHQSNYSAIRGPEEK